MEPGKELQWLNSQAFGHAGFVFLKPAHLHNGVLWTAGKPAFSTDLAELTCLHLAELWQTVAPNFGSHWLEQGGDHQPYFFIRSYSSSARSKMACVQKVCPP